MTSPNFDNIVSSNHPEIQSKDFEKTLERLGIKDLEDLRKKIINENFIESDIFKELEEGEKLDIFRLIYQNDKTNKDLKENDKTTILQKLSNFEAIGDKENTDSIFKDHLYMISKQAPNLLQNILLFYYGEDLAFHEYGEMHKNLTIQLQEEGYENLSKDEILNLAHNHITLTKEKKPLHKRVQTTGKQVKRIVYDLLKYRK